MRRLRQGTPSSAGGTIDVISHTQSTSYARLGLVLKIDFLWLYHEVYGTVVRSVNSTTANIALVNARTTARL